MFFVCFSQFCWLYLLACKVAHQLWLLKEKIEKIKFFSLILFTEIGTIKCFIKLLQKKKSRISQNSFFKNTTKVYFLKFSYVRKCIFNVFKNFLTAIACINVNYVLHQAELFSMKIPIFFVCVCVFNVIAICIMVEPIFYKVSKSSIKLRYIENSLNRYLKLFKYCKFYKDKF